MSSKCWLSVSAADFHLITAQPSLGQGAGLLHICSLSDGKDDKSVLENTGRALPVSATASMFSSLDLCLLKRGQYLYFLFGWTTLCCCSLNGEYSESEHLSKSVTAKNYLLFFRDMLGQLFVPRSDSAAFIYMCLHIISLLSDATKPVFSVFLLLALQLQLTNQPS